PEVALPEPGGVRSAVVGKAVLFARRPFHFPARGPWRRAAGKVRAGVGGMPDFADVPREGERLEGGKPVLSFFVTAPTEGGCLDALRQTAAGLDRQLFGRYVTQPCRRTR